MPHLTTAFNLLPKEILAMVVNNLTRSEQAKARLTSRVFNEVYGMLQAEGFTSKTLVTKFLHLAEEYKSLDSIMLEYLRSLAFDLGEQQDFRAYLTASSPDFWQQLAIKPADLITKLENCFNKRAKVKQATHDTEDENNNTLDTYYQGLCEIENMLYELRLYQATTLDENNKLSFILPHNVELLSKLTLIGIIKCTTSLNRPFLSQIIEIYTYLLDKSENSWTPNEKTFCEQVNKLFTEANPRQVERLSRQALPDSCIRDLLVRPQFGVLRKLDSKSLTNLITRLADKQNLLESLFAPNSYFLSEAPVKNIIYALSFIKAPQTNQTIRNSLLRKEFFQRCQYRYDKSQWINLFSAALQQASLPTSNFVECLEVLEPQTVKTAVKIFLESYIRTLRGIEASAQTLQLLKSPQVISNLDDAKIQRLVTHLSDDDFSHFFESTLDQQPHSVNTYALPRNWWERYKKINPNCSDLAQKKPRIAQLMQTAFPPATIALDQWYNNRKPDDNRLDLTPSLEMVDYLKELSALPLSKSEKYKLQFVISHLTLIFCDSQREKTKADYKLAKVLATHTSLHEYCSEWRFLDIANAYPSLASTILTHAGSQLPAEQKRKRPSLARRIVNRIGLTTLYFFSNLAVTPGYLLFGLGLVAGGAILFPLGLVLSPLALLIFSCVGNYSMSKVLEKTIVMPLAFFVTGILLPPLQVLYSLYSVENLFTGKFNQLLATAHGFDKLFIMFSGVLGRLYENDSPYHKFGPYQPTIADIAASYRKTEKSKVTPASTQEPKIQIGSAPSNPEARRHSFSMPTSISKLLLGRKVHTDANFSAADLAQQPLIPRNQV